MAHADFKTAKVTKQDEFYTQLDDITKELKYYAQYFKGKVVLCNCDDPYESNFFKYFALNFNVLGLKKLIATCYNGSPIAGDELPLLFEIEENEPKKIAYKVEITEVAYYNGDGAVNLADVQYLIQNDKNILHHKKPPSPQYHYVSTQLFVNNHNYEDIHHYKSYTSSLYHNKVHEYLY